MLNPRNVESDNTPRVTSFHITIWVNLFPRMVFKFIAINFNTSQVLKDKESGYFTNRQRLLQCKRGLRVT